MPEQEFTIKELESEEWREMAISNGTYAVSNLGRVKRLVNRTCGKAGTILRPNVSNAGYLKVSLSYGGITRTPSVHRLVAVAFLEKPSRERKCVNHIDGDRLNNRAMNLEYCTHRENTAHAYKHGRMVRGASHPMAKLTEQNVRDIRKVAKPGNFGVLARHYNLTRTAIGYIYHRKLWKFLD